MQLEIFVHSEEPEASTSRRFPHPNQLDTDFSTFETTGGATGGPHVASKGRFLFQL